MLPVDLPSNSVNCLDCDNPLFIPVLLNLSDEGHDLLIAALDAKDVNAVARCFSLMSVADLVVSLEFVKHLETVKL